jgi:hypothetical protein
MSKFSHLKALKVDGQKTVRFPLPEISVNGKSPTLLVAPATEANKEFFNAVLKRAADATRKVKGAAITADHITTTRDVERKEYAKYVIKGWEDMIGADGAPVEFSEEECLDFLEAIDGWVFDLIRVFCLDPSNFVGSVKIDVKNLAKN